MTPSAFRGPRLSLLFLAAALAGATITPARAQDGLEAFSTGDFFKDRVNQWNISPAVNAGMTRMMNGYDNYDDLGKAGLDVYFRPPLPAHEEPDWNDRMMFRLSAEYFPLQVPEGTLGLEEDIYALTGTLLYKQQNFRYQETSQLIPFLGAGAGLFIDRITLDTPATGKITGSHTNFGLTFAAGLILPRFSGFQIMPEIRYYGIRGAGSFWATHMSYQVGLHYWFGELR